LTAPKASGATTVIPLIGILALLLGGCATTNPTTNTTGAVEALMRDENYPGSTYLLVHQPEEDRLVGYYHHAVSGQTFEVVFTSNAASRSSTR